MLTNQRDNINLQSSKEHVKTYIPSNLIQYFSEKNKVYSFEFPVLKYPKNPKQVYLNEKSDKFSGKLLGIKLKLIEETWVQNSFQISEKQIQKIIKS